MKFLPTVLGTVLLAACARAATSAGGMHFDVRCELVRLESTADEPATATFRVTNRGDVALSYLGHSPDGPQYQCDVLAGEAWQAIPLGWCGTGLTEHTLEPGESLDFAAVVPRDGRSYRFWLGEPAVHTPAVTASPMR